MSIQEVTLITRHAEPNPEFEILEPPTTTETLNLVSIVSADVQPVSIRRHTSHRVTYSDPVPVSEHIAVLPGPVVPLGVRPRRLSLFTTLVAVGCSLSSVGLIALMFVQGS